MAFRHLNAVKANCNALPQFLKARDRIARHCCTTIQSLTLSGPNANQIRDERSCESEFLPIAEPALDDGFEGQTMKLRDAMVAIDGVP